MNPEETHWLTLEYTIPETNLRRLRAEIAALNKRCRRIGVPEIGMEQKLEKVALEYYRRNSDNYGVSTFWADEGVAQPAGVTPTGKRLAYYTVTITGTRPRLPGGWVFVATLEPLPTDDGNVLNITRTVPGETCPVEQTVRVGECDHCKTTRRRNQTFVVRNEEGEYRCVGRNCLKDFLGHANPHQLAAWAEILIDLAGFAGRSGEDDYDGMGGSVPDTYDIRGFLSWTASVVRADGWLSATKAREEGCETEATKIKVLWYLSAGPLRGADRDAFIREQMERTPTPADAEEAEAAVEWARELTEDVTDTSDYLRNLNVIARAGFVTRRTAGYAASIVIAYRNAMQTHANANRAPGKHVGTVGKRDTFTVKCVDIHYFETDFGTKGIYRMEDAEGNRLVWFTLGDGPERGKHYVIKATVKEHGEYKGNPQTVVARVTIVKEIEPCPATSG